MSDLFHDSVSDEFIARVFGVMALAGQHTFQLLTKRHARMRSLLSDPDRLARLDPGYLGHWIRDGLWPLRNVWVGVSVENQQWADIRVRALLDSPAAVHWLSCEPLLGQVDLTAWLDPSLLCRASCRRTDQTGAKPDCSVACRQLAGTMGTIDWVVAGGESGVGHRPLDLEWVRNLRDQCTAASVPFLFKQVGGRTPKAGGRELDGRTHDAYPERAA
jgi:protein gp37